MLCSLEDGAIGFRLGGRIAIANLDYFYPNKNVNITPSANEESWMARLYSDISLSYEDTIAPDLGSEDGYHVEDLGVDKGWRYHVCLARLHAEFRRLKKCLY